MHRQFGEIRYQVRPSKNERRGTSRGDAEIAGGLEQEVTEETEGPTSIPLFSSVSPIESLLPSLPAREEFETAVAPRRSESELELLLRLLRASA